MAISSPCAIEMEPKTLNPGQINYAKELAVRFGMAQKMDPPEALDFFLQGLERQCSTNGLEQIVKQSDYEGVYNCSDFVDTAHKSQECSCNIHIIHSPIKQQEPLTAPF